MNYDPPGIEFFDVKSQRHMKLVTGGTYEGWIVFKHPDGQWVTLRLATEDDRERLAGPKPCADVENDHE